MGSDANPWFGRQVPALRPMVKFRSHIVLLESTLEMKGKLGSDPHKGAHPDESDLSR
jgi:hypothetical protein